MDAPTMDLLPLDNPPPAATGFDYSQLDDAAANQAKAVVDRYRERQKAYVIDTGRDLLAVKERLEHGLFLEWVQAEMHMTPRSAQRAMAAAEVLGAKSDTVSYLPPTVLYELSAPSTPEPVRAAVLRRIEAGETLPADKILHEVREGRDEARKQVAAEKEAARRAKLTPEERAKEDAGNKRQRRSREAEQREMEEHRAQRRQKEAADKVKAIEAAQVLLGALGVDAAAEFWVRYGDVAGLVLHQMSVAAHVERASRVEPITVPKDDFVRIPGFGYGSHWWPDEAEVQQLAEEIRRDGLREPIVVVRNRDPDERGRYRIVDGSRRFRAVTVMLNRPEIAVRIAPPVTLDG